MLLYEKAEVEKDLISQPQRISGFVWLVPLRTMCINRLNCSFQWQFYTRVHNV